MSALQQPQSPKQGYIIRVLVALDMAANVILGGSPDETVSARAGRLRYRYPWTWGVLAWVLDHIQYHHVEMAIDHDEARADYVEDEEKKAEEEGL